MESIPQQGWLVWPQLERICLILQRLDLPGLGQYPGAGPPLSGNGKGTGRDNYKDTSPIKSQEINNSHVHKNTGAREMAHCLRKLAAFPEDLSLSPSIHMGAHNYL